ncbi:hypothetical protein NQ318_018303 [Aromia moschata]|uniref:Uncharacterized protein n=1 Tax=Aromia moschata TaxID=1265417 RepID=A0AAV8ZF71_9CUCU|nr:hypothetical protein NQ318_018303 [Aromia moschata]
MFLRQLQLRIYYKSILNLTLVSEFFPIGCDFDDLDQASPTRALGAFPLPSLSFTAQPPLRDRDRQHHILAILAIPGAWPALGAAAIAPELERPDLCAMSIYVFHKVAPLHYILMYFFPVLHTALTPYKLLTLRKDPKTLQSPRIRSSTLSPVAPSRERRQTLMEFTRGHANIQKSNYYLLLIVSCQLPVEPCGRKYDMLYRCNQKKKGNSTHEETPQGFFDDHGLG